MLRFRPYKPCDAPIITSWIRDEFSFRQWCADRFEHYPLTAEALNAHYAAQEMNDAFFPMTAYDETGVQGHMILRFTDPEKKNLRFGFVIINSEKRRMGYGLEMMKLALQYGFQLLKAQRISLGVFENNPAAQHCYRAAGFREIALPQPITYTLLGETWKCIEMEKWP